MSERSDTARHANDVEAGDIGVKVDSNTLDAHLRNWARWMQARQLPKGYPSSGSGGVLGYRTEDWDSDRAYDDLDGWLARNTDAAVNALAPAEQCAVYVEYELTAVWRFPRCNREELLRRARLAIRATLARRGVVVTG